MHPAFLNEYGSWVDPQRHGRSLVALCWGISVDRAYLHKPKGVQGIVVLRKVNLSTSALTNNAVSFVNQTARRLHIRKSAIRGLPQSGAGTLGDSQIASLDEVPIIQANVNDSRSHIQSASAVVAGGTGQVEAQYHNSVQSYGRDDLVLEPDEALFLNIADISGALDMDWSCNLWYET